MDSSPVLRQQSQNKIRTDFQRMKNEHNKKQAEPKLSKLLPSPCLSDKNCENKDPAESCQRPPLQPGISRLPVLAKSLRLQTPSDFSQSHFRWEEKPLSGKTKKKKPCTRPVPFNLSQPKNTKMTAENRRPVPAPQSRTHAVQLENKHCYAKPPKHQTVLSSKRDPAKVVGKSHGKTPEKVSHLPGESGPSNTWKTLANPSSSVPSDTIHQNNASSSVQPAASTEICLDTMNLLSLKDSSKTSNTGQTAPLTMQGNPSKGLSGENFQPDHAGLLSILQNEGIGIVGRVSATPQTKAYSYLPHRVSVMKSQQKAGSSTASVKSVHFSPDSAALQSILMNEGVKDRGPGGATPRNSVCPPGKGTSIYTAQRVPLIKNCAEATGAPAALKETPQTKWTPQRVRNTKHQPMSAMKWHQLTQQSLFCSPGVKSCKSNLQPHQKEVVQRLFDDPKDEQTINVMDKAPEIKLPCEVKVETSKTNSEEEEQMFLQAPPRESVIFFSTGKKLLRVPRFENLESSAQENQHGPVSSDQGRVPTAHDEISAESELISQINPSVQHLHRDVVATKSYPNPAVAMLRKRLPPLEELRLDEEVATYTSVSVPATAGFIPPRPRCGNPLASILHFEESTRFLPIGFDLSCDPLSLHSSPLHER